MIRYIVLFVLLFSVELVGASWWVGCWQPVSTNEESVGLADEESFKISQDAVEDTLASVEVPPSVLEQVKEVIDPTPVAVREPDASYLRPEDVTVSIPLPTTAEDKIKSATMRVSVLEFSASWCGPCRQMKPIVEKLQQEGYDIVCIDVDAKRDIAQAYHVDRMPTFIKVDINGNELERHVGACSADTIKSLLTPVQQK